MRHMMHCKISRGTSQRGHFWNSPDLNPIGVWRTRRTNESTETKPHGSEDLKDPLLTSWYGAGYDSTASEFPRSSRLDRDVHVKNQHALVPLQEYNKSSEHQTETPLTKGTRSCMKEKPHEKGPKSSCFNGERKQSGVYKLAVSQRRPPSRKISFFT